VGCRAKPCAFKHNWRITFRIDEAGIATVSTSTTARIAPPGRQNPRIFAGIFGYGGSRPK
jgi:hypothetical protein